MREDTSAAAATCTVVVILVEEEEEEEEAAAVAPESGFNTIRVVLVELLFFSTSLDDNTSTISLLDDTAVVDSLSFTADISPGRIIFDLLYSTPPLETSTADV